MCDVGFSWGSPEKMQGSLNVTIVSECSRYSEMNANSTSKFIMNHKYVSMIYFPTLLVPSSFLFQASYQGVT